MTPGMSPPERVITAVRVQTALSSFLTPLRCAAVCMYQPLTQGENSRELSYSCERCLIMIQGTTVQDACTQFAPPPATVAAAADAAATAAGGAVSQMRMAKMVVQA